MPGEPNANQSFTLALVLYKRDLATCPYSLRVALCYPGHPKSVSDRAMDPSSSSKLPRPSGIPRPPTTKSSKLPIPSSLPQRSKTPQPTSSTPRAIPTSSLPGRAASTTRPSLASSSRPPPVKDDSVFKKPAPPRPMSRQARSRIQRPAVAAISTRLEQQEDDQLGDLNGFRVSSRMSHRDSPAGEWEDEELLSIRKCASSL